MSENHGYTHRAVVLSATGVDAHVEIPALAPGASWGPIPTAVPGLAPGDAVLVTQVGLSQDTLVVAARVPGRVPDQSEIPGLAAVIADLQAADAGLDTRLGTAEATILDHTGTLGGHTTEIAGHDTEIAGHETRLASLEALRHRSAVVTTLVSTGSTVYVPLGSDDIAITMPYPPSGIISVNITASIAVTAVGPYGTMSYEIRDNNASGTQRWVAADGNAAFQYSVTASTAIGIASRTSRAISLPTSGTAYIRAMYKTGGATAQFAYRSLVAMPSP